MQQEIFSELLVKLRALYPDSVYDGALPPEGTKYPFIYIAGTTTSNRNTKTCCRGGPGDVSITIHIYHNNVRQRGRLSGMVDTVEDVCYSMKTATCVGYGCQIIPDDTTAVPLMHAIVSADFIN